VDQENDGIDNEDGSNEGDGGSNNGRVATLTSLSSQNGGFDHLEAKTVNWEYRYQIEMARLTDWEPSAKSALRPERPRRRNGRSVNANGKRTSTLEPNGRTPITLRLQKRCSEYTTCGEFIAKYD